MIETGSSANRVKNGLECNCNSSNVVWTTCSLSDCNTGMCSTTTGGCGFFWGDDCDGLCL